jgi:hypothetical protein
MRTMTNKVPLEKQIANLERLRRIFKVLGTRAVKRGRVGSWWVSDCIAALEEAIKLAAFTRDHEQVIRKAVTKHKAAKKDPVVAAVLDEFPGAEIVGVTDPEDFFVIEN